MQLSASRGPTSRVHVGTLVSSVLDWPRLARPRVATPTVATNVATVPTRTFRIVLFPLFHGTPYRSPTNGLGSAFIILRRYQLDRVDLDLLSPPGARHPHPLAGVAQQLLFELRRIGELDGDPAKS